MLAERECIEYGNSPDCVTYADEVWSNFNKEDESWYAPALNAMAHWWWWYWVMTIPPDTLKVWIENSKEILTKEVSEIKDILKDATYFSREEIIDLIWDSIKEEVESLFNLEEIYQHIVTWAIIALSGILLSKVPWAKALKIIKKIKDKLFKRKKSKEERELIHGWLIFSGYIGWINWNDNSDIKYKKVTAFLNEIKSNTRILRNIEKYWIHIPTMLQTLNEHMKNGLDSITTRFLNWDKTTWRIIVTIHMTKKWKMNILIEDNWIWKKEINSRVKRSNRFNHLYCWWENIWRKNVDSMKTSHNKLTYRKWKTKAITQVHWSTPRFIEIDSCYF